MLLKCTPANVNSMYFRIFLGVFILYLKYLSKKKKKNSLVQVLDLICLCMPSIIY
jgi:hypothetical protein